MQKPNRRFDLPANIAPKDQAAFAEDLLIQATMKLMDVHRNDPVVLAQLEERLEGFMGLKTMRLESEERLRQLKIRHELQNTADDRKLAALRQRNAAATNRDGITRTQPQASRATHVPPVHSEPDGFTAFLQDATRFGLIGAGLKTLLR